MSVANDHIVKNLRLNLQCPDRDQAFSIQEEITALLMGTILPGLQPLLDQLGTGTTHYLDSLDLELGNFSRTELQTQLPQRFQKAILQEIDSLKRSGEQGNGKATSDNKAEVEPTAVQHFLHFLQTGTLPWSASTPSIRQLETELLKLDVPLLIDEARLLQLIVHNDIRKRLAHQFTSHFQLQLLQHLEAGIGAFWDQWKHNIGDKRQVDAPADLRTLFRQWFPRTNFNLEDGLPQLLPLKETEVLETFWMAASGEMRTRGPKPAVKVIAALGKVKGLDTETIQALKRKADAQHAAENHSNKTEIENKSESQSTDSDRNQSGDHAKKHTKTIQLDELYLNHVGVVLLHPFLSTHFQKVGLMNNQKQFNTPPDQERAVYLLHYLVSGETTVEEPLTPLYKILCGIDIATPLGASSPIRDDEIEEGKKVLQAVLHHWDRLKSTSIEGLRINFLSRQGKLTEQEGHWKLVVEQKAYDLLLNSLPWNLGIIKLPWIKNTLYVDWG